MISAALGIPGQSVYPTLRRRVQFRSIAMSTDDKRIREFAYQIWESEGKPEGQEAATGRWRANWPKLKRWRRNNRQKRGQQTGRQNRQQGWRGQGGRAKAKAGGSPTVIPAGEKAAGKSLAPRASRRPTDWPGFS
jgi:hypothetical protein